MITNKWWGLLLGIAIGGGLGYLNYQQILKGVLATDPKAALKKSSFSRFILIFIGLYLAIRLGGFPALLAAVISLLVLSSGLLFFTAKKLSPQEGKEQAGFKEGEKH